jgi:hypothetical protein
MGLFDTILKGIGIGAAPVTGGASLLATALPSLIEVGGGLLGGFLSGAEKKKEQKQAYEMWEKKRNAIKSDLKPTLPRYNIEKDYGTLDPLFKKLVVGGLMNSLGDKAGQYGIDFSSILAALAGNTPTATPNFPGEANLPMPRVGGGAEGGRGRLTKADQIMGKYGMMA